MAKVKKRTTGGTKGGTKGKGTKGTKGGTAAKKTTGVRGPTGRPQGKTTGLGVQAAWVHIFEQNEKVAKAKRLTDDGISAFMHKEFPGRQSKVFDGVQSVRTKYNKGGLTGGEVPKTQSIRYGDDGSASPTRVGRPAAAAPATKAGKAKGGKSRSRRSKAA